MEKILPKGWVEIELGEILKLKNGYAFKSKNYLNEGIPVIRISDIQQGAVTFKKAVRVKPDNIPNDFLLEKGDVLVAMSGATTGKFGIFLEDEPALQNQRVGNLKPYSKKHTDKKYIYYLIGALKKEIEDKAYGGAQPNISAKLIEGIICGFPPLPEQKRIVKKLDTLFGHLERLKNLLETVPQLVKDFRQSVLTEAVTGKLTEEWRVGKELESVEKTVDKILERRRKHSKKKIRNSVINLRSDLDLFDLDKTWVWADLAFLMDEDDSFCYGVVQPGSYIENEQKLIRVLDLKNGKVLYQQLRGISWDIDKKYKRSKVKSGDIIISVVGTIGRSAIVDINSEGFNLARAVAKIPIKDFNSKYIKIFIDSHFGQKWLIGDAREVARKTLNLEQLKTLPLPIPSLPEQTEIVRQVEHLLKIADKIEAQHEVLKAKIDVLPQAILAKAFRGELVEQLETDGDARELLKAIAEMKAAMKPKKKRKKK